MAYLQTCLVGLLVCGIIPHTWSKGMAVNMYFPEVEREISKITWAHAVNSHKALHEAIADPSIMMLEADILMGFHEGHKDIQPIMAHPPADNSDLTFVQFLDTVITGIKVNGKRKGIKLDFKDINAVEPCLKHLRSRLEEGEVPSFPIFVNADILEGPVAATKKPMDAEKFLYLCKTYAPYAVLSVGWTTRYGMDDPSEEIREGKYTKAQMKEMIKVIRNHTGDPSVFPHITFPVRASLAAQSIDELLYLTSRVRAQEVSLTLWSPNTDPVNREELQSLVLQATTRHVFVDLPFSLDDSEASHEPHRHQHQEPQQEQPVSGIHQLEARVHPEADNQVVQNESSGVGSALTRKTVLPILAIGLLAAFLAYRRQ